MKKNNFLQRLLLSAQIDIKIRTFWAVILTVCYTFSVSHANYTCNDVRTVLGDDKMCCHSSEVIKPPGLSPYGLGSKKLEVSPL